MEDQVEVRAAVKTQLQLGRIGCLRKLTYYSGTSEIKTHSALRFVRLPKLA